MHCRGSCYDFIPCILSENVHISVSTAVTERNEMWSILVRKGDQERNQITEWYLFLASDTFSMDFLHTGRIFINYVFYTLSILLLGLWPCYGYIRLSFWMSLALNPDLWPICAFASCSINRHVHFSFRLTVHIKLNETSKLCISYVLLCCKCKNKTHTNNLCALCGIVEFNRWNLYKEYHSDKRLKILYSPWHTVVLLNWQTLLTVWSNDSVVCSLVYCGWHVSKIYH
jgi:hypothetical protein